MAIPLERINMEAQSVHLGRLLLTVVAALFYALGWSAGKAAVAVAWSVAAMRVGWRDARRGQSVEPSR